MKIYFGFTVAGDRSTIETARRVVRPRPVGRARRQQRADPSSRGRCADRIDPRVPTNEPPVCVSNR